MTPLNTLGQNATSVILCACRIIHGSWLTPLLVIAPRTVISISGAITGDWFSNLVYREDVTKYQQLFFDVIASEGIG